MPKKTVVSAKVSEKWEKVANAFFRFVQRNPPKDFPLYNLILTANMGDTDKVVQILDNFNPRTEQVEA